MELSKGHLQGKVPQHRSLEHMLVSHCCLREQLAEEVSKLQLVAHPGIPDMEPNALTARKRLDTSLAALLL